MTSYTTAAEKAKDMLDKGELPDRAAYYVLIVQMMGARLVTSLTADERRALNAAVKAGKLGHLKRDGRKPEAYFHINGKARALQLRDDHHREVDAAVASVCAPSGSGDFV